MIQAHSITLPFRSRLLIHPAAVLPQQWTLPIIPKESLFANLPMCLHDRHSVIRERLIVAWREPIAEMFQQRLQIKLNGALKALEQRLSAWIMALGLPIVFVGCKHAQQVASEITDELFRADGIDKLLKTVVATIARNTRNFTTAHWLDREYGRIIDAHSRDANPILAMVLTSCRIQNRLAEALQYDASRFGFELRFNREPESAASTEQLDHKPELILTTVG